MSSFGNDSSRGGSKPPLPFFFSWFGSTENRRLVVNIVLDVRAKNHGLEVPVKYIDLAPRTEESLSFAKLRRCDIGESIRAVFSA